MSIFVVTGKKFVRSFGPVIVTVIDSNVNEKLQEN